MIIVTYEAIDRLLADMNPALPRDTREHYAIGMYEAYQAGDIAHVTHMLECAIHHTATKETV